MQVFGNVAIQPTRKESKTTGKGYYEFRLAESQRGIDTNPTWYTVRLMQDKNPMLERGDFVKVTGKLKTDFYFAKDGKPSGTLLIIAFEAAKIAKHALDGVDAVSVAIPVKETVQTPRPQAVPTLPAERIPETMALPTVKATPHEEPDWTVFYT
nr:hypothetical protein [uncultured Albidiferax sp.]